ncbi:zinc-binding dehydrogenase [Loigolactobacillus binensis]|uniref:Zinc-binding dehydrogenase n=1 Tax=Loigolactobacillus binensis TaxID=2559922 RepID=A0ABW3EF73_9LACO|nr:zinc-binding dehydrogenase [Loigolactobacillus binensis]
MKAIVVRRPGGPEVLEYTEVPTPQVKPGWSLIKVKGFGINHSEIFTREGKSPSVKFPRILGIEAVGVVAKSTTDQLAVGQKVISIMGEMGRAFDGGYAEYVLLPNAQIYPVSTSLSWAELAAFPETFYTAYGALLGLQLRPTDQLLIRGGTAGVGVAAAKLAQAMAPGITISGSTRSLAKTAQMQAVGYNQVILDQNNQLQTTAKFDKILDLIGPLTVENSLKLLQPGGIVSVTGELGGVWSLAAFDPIFAIPNDRYLTSFSSDEVDSQRIGALLALIENKHIDVRPVKQFSLNQTRQAHEYLASHASFGKVVVLP